MYVQEVETLPTFSNFKKGEKTMAVRTQEEIVNAIKELSGESTDDKVLGLLEDVSDTFKDFQSKESEDWKKKYEDNDAEWRRKYKERFFNTEVKEEDDVFETNPRKELDEPKAPSTFEELFKTE